MPGFGSGCRFVCRSSGRRLCAGRWSLRRCRCRFLCWSSVVACQWPAFVLVAGCWLLVGVRGAGCLACVVARCPWWHGVGWCAGLCWTVWAGAKVGAGRAGWGGWFVVGGLGVWLCACCRIRGAFVVVLVGNLVVVCGVVWCGVGAGGFWGVEGGVWVVRMFFRIWGGSGGVRRIGG